MAAIDPEVVAMLRTELAPEDMAALLHFYEADALAMLAALRAAGEDLTAWQRTAHRLAGGAGGVGAKAVEATARALMHDPFPPDRAAVLARLEREIAASIAALAQAIAGDA